MGHEQPIAGTDVEGPIRHKLAVEEFLILDEPGVFGSPVPSATIAGLVVDTASL